MTFEIYEVRQEGETPTAWLAFCCYRDLGPGRTITAAIAAYNKAKAEGDRKKVKSPSVFSEWRAANNWDVRIDLYDSHQQAKIRERALASDSQEYLKKLDQFTETLDRIGSTGLEIANAGLTEIHKELAGMAAIEGSLDVRRSGLLASQALNYIKVAGEARLLVAEVCGLVDLIKRLVEDLPP